MNGDSTVFPVSVEDNGTVLISGLSLPIMRAVLSGVDISPYRVLRETLDGERYQMIKDALNTPPLSSIDLELGLYSHCHCVDTLINCSCFCHEEYDMV